MSAPVDRIPSTADRPSSDGPLISVDAIKAQWGAAFEAAEAALRAMKFVARWQDPDGGFPQVVYADGRVNRFPRWVAAVGTG